MDFEFLKERERRYWFKSKERSEFQVKGPLTKDKVLKISKFKGDPDWVAKSRIKGFDFFKKLKMPKFGPDLSGVDFEDLIYYSKPSDKARKWEDVPEDIKTTFEKLGISGVEMKMLSGVGLQYDSEVIFEKAKKGLDKLGVIYMSMDEAVKKHPELVRKYMGKIVPPTDNKFAALNNAVWSGGTFIYVPKNVKVPFPLHTYFRINLEGFGQFERTLIIVEEGAEVTYVEGCTAPLYNKSTIHSAVVELVALPNSKLKYITLQNWSNNVYNLVTKRAFAYSGAFVQWIDGNFGSKVTMKYPAICLLEPNARGEVVSIALVSDGQNIDSGARMIHRAPHTHSNMISKTVSLGTGIATFRGTVRIYSGAKFSKANTECDSLLIGDSVANAIPKIEVMEDTASLNHEARMGNVDKEKLLYLMSRGIDEKTAMSMLVFGFVRDFVNELPLEYALELQRLIEFDMGGHS
ncbi:MAG: Fe-S cluster assembly protein SufB [Candidatus Altiarchaeota archaeon]|nr:Fe-S cluster assembly protein SufB [Candidatus Altiarchaeota archaeon]